jgi:RHS repeat-associated protein
MSGTDNGNVIQIANGKNSNRTQNFVYDPLNRIWQAYSSGPNWGETYSQSQAGPGTAFSASVAGIDAWGNLTNRSPVTGKTNYEPLNCQVTASNQFLVSCGFNYDAAGNLIKNGNDTFTYDAENRLIASIVATNGTSYVYDGDGNRVEKCTEATTTMGAPEPGVCASNATGLFYFLHEEGGTLAETDLSGNWTATYGLVRGQIVERVDLPANVVHYYFHDHLNSTSIVTDGSGNIENESDYYPYGGEMVISSGDTNRYKFTGKERDAESNLDYFGARHYASSLGRYMRPDDPFADQHPGDPQSWNLYSYVRNNPLNATDPSGHECVSNGNGGWQWSGSGETCEDVDAQNEEYKQSGQASATVNGCEGEGAASCLGAMVSDLTSTSSLSEVGVNGILGAQAAEGACELPGLFRSGWDLLSGWRMASKMAGVRAAGEAGELAAGIIKNTERISSSTGSAAYRVPDILDHANKIIGEVKNYTTTTVNLTNQLKDDLAYAAANGYTMELRVRQGAQLSQSVQQLVDQGKIVLTRF